VLLLDEELDELELVELVEAVLVRLLREVTVMAQLRIAPAGPGRLLRFTGSYGRASRERAAEICAGPR